MKVLIIFALIFLFLIGLSLLSITFRVTFDEKFTISAGIGKIRYTLLPAKGEKKEKKPKKGDIKATVLEALDIIKPTIPLIIDFIKKIRITSFCVNVMVGGEDSAAAAVNYGKISALVYGGLAFLRNLIRIKVKSISINCDFLKNNIEQKIFFKVKIRIFHIVLAALRIGYIVLVNTLKRTKSDDSDLSEKK